MATARANWSLRDSRFHKESEIRRLIRSAKRRSLRDYTLLGLCYNAALRACELIHLKVSDFDLATGFVSIVPAKRTHPNEIRKNGKTIVSERIAPMAVRYPLPWKVVSLVSRWIRENRLSTDGWLFPGASSYCTRVGEVCMGDHLSKREAQRIYHTAAKAAGLERAGRGIHSLKHSRLIEFAHKTRDPWFVRDAGRLASVVTADVYVRHITMQETIRAIGGTV